MTALAIVAILAAVAMPSYREPVLRSRARGASTDLVAMSVALENRFQRTLQYPVYSTETTVAALPASRTGTLTTDFSTWAPAQGANYNFSVQSTATTYTLKAVASTAGVSCTLTMTNGNVRTATGSQCGMTSW